MSIELDLARELVKGRAVKSELKKEIKISNGTIKDLDERETEIVKELGVHFFVPEYPEDVSVNDDD